MPIHLVGREAQLDQLAQLASSAASGVGGLVLLSGEAGVGKTALARAALAAADLQVIRVASAETPGPVYGPVSAVFRAYARGGNSLLRNRPALRPYLARVLPELGPVAPGEVEDGRDVLLEAVAEAMTEIALSGPLGVLFDDIHWADVATLDVLAFLAEVVEGQPILLVASYRSDAVPRGHPVRRLRAELRRAGRLREVAVDPLSPAEASLLLKERLGGAPGGRLATAVYDRTEGIPFFIEELAAALLESGSLRSGASGLELHGDMALPLPDSVRDAVLMRADRLPDALRDALARAAVAGQEFELATLMGLLGGDEALSQLPSSGFVEELEPGRLAFRHALVRDALYAAIPWSRRRVLHQLLGARLERLQVTPHAVAVQWLAAGDHERARTALLSAVEMSWQACAYRDAAAQLSRALDLWPAGTDPGGRLAALERLARCAELSGEPAQAIRALTDAADLLEAAGHHRRYADVQRRLAGQLELKGAWERALAARQLAAAAFSVAGEPGEAAVERLAAAARLRSAGSFRASLELIELGKRDAEKSNRSDVALRLLALEGNVKARAGNVEEGVSLVHSALSRALAENQVGAAAEAYQRLADSLEHAGDYRGALETYLEAASFCRSSGAEAMGAVCLACLSVVLRQTGEWDRAIEVCKEVLASRESNLHALSAAHGVMGSILAHRGQPSRARPELHSANVLAREIGLAAMEIDSEANLARLAAAGGHAGEGLERCWRVVRRWERTDGERHYSVPVLRWMVTFAAEQGSRDLVQACTSALVRITSQPDSEALAALANALGESALMDGEADTAGAQFEQALSLLSQSDLPFERAETEWRVAAIHAMRGLRSEALDRYRGAYRTAKRLGARPMANRIAEEVAGLGEKVERRLGRLAASGLGQSGLSMRELEVARLVAQGLTSREVASTLSLSPRTVEMHVHRILVKLDCRTRVDITRSMGELGLLA